MSDLTHVKVGDTVMRRDANENRNDSLKGPREVVSVGRVYITIKGDRRKFDRTSGRAADAYGHARLQTLEDYEAGERLVEHTRKMRAAGVEFVMGCRLTNAQRIAVALAVVAAVGPGEGER